VEKNVLYVGAKINRRYRRLKEIIRTCALRIILKFDMGLSSSMHQTSNNRYNPIIRTVTEAYKSHRLLADFRRQNGMVKNRAFLSICILHILPSVIINSKDLLKTRLIFNFYAHISCKKRLE